MNFTREPIIETIITPRDGCRLIIRSSRSESSEEFTVDAVEVVSFGSALFFRSLERPRPFLVPVSDYEVVEAKESRVVLKNAQFERTIKIGGGREGSLRKEEEEEPLLPVALEEEVAEESSPQHSHDRKRDRGRRNNNNNRRRRGHEDRDEPKPRTEEAPAQEAKPPKEPLPVPEFKHLIPPPTTLISDNIQKYKDQQSGAQTPPEPLNDVSDQESTPISRTAVEAEPLTTHFSNLNSWNHFLS